MKEKVIFTTALCLSAMTPMMAQNITGKVMNTKGEPLAQHLQGRNRLFLYS